MFWGDDSSAERVKRVKISTYRRIGNHTNHHYMGFLWLPILRYVEIFHTRLCTAVITPKTHILLFAYKIEIVVTFIWILYVYQFTYLPFYDIV